MCAYTAGCAAHAAIWPEVITTEDPTSCMQHNPIQGRAEEYNY